MAITDDPTATPTAGGGVRSIDIGVRPRLVAWLMLAMATAVWAHAFVTGALSR